MMLEVPFAACLAAQPQPLWRQHTAVGLWFVVKAIGDTSATCSQQRSTTNSKIQRCTVNGIVWAIARNAVLTVRI
jgi:hypothetical protein